MSAVRLRPQDVTRAAEVMHEGIAAGDADLAVLAVADSRLPVHLETAAPIGRECEVREDAVFLLASITKPFVATAVAQLAQEGRLLFSDTVARYVPEFGRHGKDGVSIWHLLTHTSGLAEEMPKAASSSGPSPREHLEAACDSYLQFPPGSAYQYCNSSFWVLAEVISRVSGRDYKDYLRERICEPLGMVDTSFAPEGARRERLVPVPLDPKAAGFTFEYFVSLAHPAGGICSTAADLTSFGQAVLQAVRGLENPILSPAAARAITALHTAGVSEYRSSRPARYGLGWAKTPVQAGLLSSDAGFGHGGATATMLWVEPERDLVFVFLTNVWKENRVARLALNALLGAG